MQAQSKGPGRDPHEPRSALCFASLSGVTALPSAPQPKSYPSEADARDAVARATQVPQLWTQAPSGRGGHPRRQSPSPSVHAV